MKSIVFDTNVLLDLFVFSDLRALDLKQALEEKRIDAVATQKTLEEFADVLSRPLFSLEESRQADIFYKWQCLSRTISDQDLTAAPWQCDDPDDQVFLNLTYSIRPSTLISKDKALLKLAGKAYAEGILITSDYNAF